MAASVLQMVGSRVLECYLIIVLLPTVALPYSNLKIAVLPPEELSCQVTGKPGDCNAEACGHGHICEAKYIRFWDPTTRTDRTQKSCQCLEDSVCPLFGKSGFSGCRNYAFLSASAQKIVRDWSMTKSERNSRFSTRLQFSNESANRVWPSKSRSASVYSDKSRHHQLILGNTRFCCHIKENNHLAAAMSSSSLPAWCPCWFIVYASFIVLVLQRFLTPNYGFSRVPHR